MKICSQNLYHNHKFNRYLRKNLKKSQYGKEKDEVEVRASLKAKDADPERAKLRIKTRANGLQVSKSI